MGAETVHLHQQLVEGLLTLVMSAAKTRAAVATHRVNLVDKHDTGRGFARGFKQVAHTGGTDAHVHLYEIRAGNRVKGHAGFTCHRFGKQGFTRTGRADKQHAVRDFGAEFRKLLRVLEEFHNLFQFLFFLVRARHVLEGGGIFAVVCGAHMRLAETVELRPAAARRPQKEEPQHHKHDDHNQVREERDPPRVGGLRLDLIGDKVGVGAVLPAVILKHLQRPQLIRYLGGDKTAVLAAQQRSVLRRFDDLHGQAVVLVDDEGDDPVAFKIAHHIAEQQLFIRRAVEDGCQHGDNHADQQQVKQYRFQMLFHVFLHLG